MWTIDFAEDFSGLSASQIHRLEKKGILSPAIDDGTAHYSYNDIYVLRLFYLMKQEGLPTNHGEDAFQYLRAIKPSRQLSSFVLLHDSKCIYTVIDLRTVNATRYGQLVLKHVLELKPFGLELERTRKAMKREKTSIQRATVKALKEQSEGRLKTYTADTLHQIFA